MDKAFARNLLAAALSLDDALGRVDSLISGLDDEVEKRNLAVKLGEIMRMINEYFIVPTIKIYPDLDPETTEN